MSESILQVGATASGRLSIRSGPFASFIPTRSTPPPPTPVGARRGGARCSRDDPGRQARANRGDASLVSRLAEHGKGGQRMAMDELKELRQQVGRRTTVGHMLTARPLSAARPPFHAQTLRPLAPSLRSPRMATQRHCSRRSSMRCAAAARQSVFSSRRSELRWGSRASQPIDGADPTNASAANISMRRCARVRWVCGGYQPRRGAAHARSLRLLPRTSHSARTRRVRVTV